MAKKKNSRKALAVALGIMGIAGLSVASASQLTINAADEVAAGTTTINGACDNEVDVDYGFDLSTRAYTSIDISGIDANCVGQKLQYDLKDNGGTSLASGSVDLDDTTVYSIPLSAPIGIEGNILGSIDMAIY